MHQLLYWHEERIPEPLRKMVLASIPNDVFLVEKTTYKEDRKIQLEKIKNAEVILFAPGRWLDDEQMDAARHVKLMQLWSSGYDKFNIRGATQRGIPVANNGGANASCVAEHAILLMLAVYKWLPDSHQRTITGNWTGNSHGLDMFMLEGKRVGIVGFGNIGRQVAKKLKGFDADICYFDLQRAPESVERELGATFMSFDELLGSSDIVTLHLHSTIETRNIIGREQIDRMKNGCVLINVSRAELVDQVALKDALESGKMHGAGVDVYINEPTTGQEPILKLKNIVATPHMAGSTHDVYAKALKNCVQNCVNAVKGESLKWLVNPAYEPKEVQKKTN